MSNHKLQDTNMRKRFIALLNDESQVIRKFVALEFSRWKNIDDESRVLASQLF
jgi:hypothetical protein